MRTTSPARHKPLSWLTLGRVPHPTLTFFSLLLAFFLLGNTPAAGWWRFGHSHITEGAIAHLPQPLRGFFEDNLNTVSALSASEPPGKHYIDIDVYPEFFAGTLPHDLDDLIDLYGFAHVDQYGMGPWTFADYVETLANEMAAAADEQDWLDLLTTAAAQAHYIEDLHNPLHLTLNYNGQLTGNNGIHARYEGEMIERHPNDLTFTQANSIYLPSVIDFVFDGIDNHYPFVADILAADSLYAGPYDETYYAGLWNETGAFTQNLFQEASEAVASSWYTAWVNAGSPTTFLGYTADFDLDGDIEGDDFLKWQRAESPNPLSATDLTMWESGYGTAHPLSATSASVPEPTSSVLALAALCLTMSKRRIASSSDPCRNVRYRPAACTPVRNGR